MAIEHKDLPDSGLHEPKGIATAASKRAYISNGAGSGSWAKVDADALQGTVANSSVSGLRLETDGSGGFSTVLAPAASFGTMNLTENTTTQAVTAAVDPTLRTNSDYQAVVPVVTYASIQGMTTGSNSLIISNPGLYIVDFWANIKSSVNATLVGMKFGINGTTFVERSPKNTMASSGALHNLSANGVHTFQAGDEIKMYVASSTSANITIEDMTFQIIYLGSFS